MAVSEAMIMVERDSLSRMFTAIAVARGIEAVAYSDPQLMASSDAVRHLAETLDQVSADVLVKLATVNQASDGLLAELIVARAAEVGCALPSGILG